MYKKVLFISVLALIGIQFIQLEKNTTKAPQFNSIVKLYPVPNDVSAIFKRACNDCHSNNTSYPWYSNIQPIAWWLNDHILEGKKHLNFDEFANYSYKRQQHKLQELIESQEDGWMPLESYTWLHQNAKLNQQEKQKIILWASQTINIIEKKTK